MQALCLRVPQHAFCFARLTAARLREEGVRGEVTVLEGEYAGPLTGAAPMPAEPVVVFAGRHIPEKRAPAIVPAVARARARVPELRARILGDGPERGAVLAAIAREGLEGVVEAPGFVDGEVVDHDLARALCMVLPSSREGYGMVVVEASAAGTPSVVVRGEDNAATELVEEGVNGFVADSASPEDLAAAIVRVHEAGGALRDVDRRVVRAQRAAALARHLARRGRAELHGVTPRVSVLIGAYNSAATLEEAIRAILGQTVEDLELIVVDDGSADESAALADAAAARDARVSVLRMPRNVGISRSLNAGLEAARAPVVAVQDADDVSAPARLERQLALLDARPDVAVVGSRMREVDPEGRELRPRTAFAPGDVRAVLPRFNPIPNTSAAFRRDVVLAAGGYDPRYRYAMEYDLWLRLAERHVIWRARRGARHAADERDQRRGAGRAGADGGGDRHPRAGAAPAADAARRARRRPARDLLPHPAAGEAGAPPPARPGALMARGRSGVARDAAPRERVGAG